MNEIKKHAVLLIILSILLIAKFIYIPIINWQNALHSEIQQQEKKLVKIDKVLRQKGKINQANFQLEKLLTIKTSVFFPSEEETKFQLKQQKMLESLFKKSKLKLTKFAWRRTQALASLSASHYKLQVNFSGKMSQLVQLMSAIESFTPYIEVSDFTFNIKRQKGPLLGMVTGNLILHLYTDNS